MNAPGRLSPPQQSSDLAGSAAGRPTSFELHIIAQMIRWFEIRLVTPQELNVVHPTVLMIDLRRRIAASPRVHVQSQAMDYTFARMANWWQEHTITSAWRSLRADVSVKGAAVDLADGLADFIWNVRGLIQTSKEKGEA